MGKWFMGDGPGVMGLGSGDGRLGLVGGLNRQSVTVGFVMTKQEGSMNRLTRLGYGVATAMLVATGGAMAGQLNTSYTYLEPSEGDFEDDVSQHEAKISGMATVMSVEDYVVGVAVGGALQANIWTFDGDADDLDLYKVMLPVKFTMQATEQMPVHLTLIPGIHSDFEDVDGDDFRVDGTLASSYPYSEKLKFEFGVAVGEEFGDPKAYPIGGIRWTATDALQVDLLFPSPKISYALTDEFRAFLAGAPAGGQWNVGESEDVQIDVEQKGYRVGLGAEGQVGAGWLYAMVGSEGGREISLAIDDDEVVDEEELDDAMFVQIGFRIL